MKNIAYKIKNKKGNIPITVLVVGVFALCSFALLTFFVSDFRVSNSFVGIKIMQEMNGAVDEYSFYKLQGLPIEDINGFYNLTEKTGRKYFYFEKRYNEFNLMKLGFDKTLLFSVDYPIPN